MVALNGDFFNIRHLGKNKKTKNKNEPFIGSMDKNKDTHKQKKKQKWSLLLEPHFLVLSSLGLGSFPSPLAYGGGDDNASSNHGLHVRVANFAPQGELKE